MAAVRTTTTGHQRGCAVAALLAMVVSVALARSAGAQNVSVSMVDFSQYSPAATLGVGVTAVTGSTCTFTTYAVAVVQNTTITWYTDTVAANTLIIKGRWSTTLATQTAVKPFVRLFNTTNWPCYVHRGQAPLCAMDPNKQIGANVTIPLGGTISSSFETLTIDITGAGWVFPPDVVYFLSFETPRQAEDTVSRFAYQLGRVTGFNRVQSYLTRSVTGVECGNGGAVPNQGTFAPMTNSDADSSIGALTMKLAYIPPSSTPSPTPVTATSTNTVTVTPSESPMPTGTATSSYSCTPSGSVTETATPSESATPSVSATSTFTSTATLSESTTPSVTPTSTFTSTATPTESTTPSVSATSTFTSTPSESPTPTASVSSAATSTPTGSPSESPTPTASVSSTITSTSTVTSSVSPTATVSESGPMTSLPTAAPTETPLVSSTTASTPAGTGTAAGTTTQSESATSTALPSVMASSSVTGTETPTLAPSATHTSSATVSVTRTSAGTPSDTRLPTPAPLRVVESVLVGLSLAVRPDADTSTMVADVDAIRAAIITTLTSIVGVPPAAVSRFVLRLPDCTQLTLEPRLPLGRRRLADNDGTGAVPCTPTADRMQVLLVVDTSSIGGNATVETALARVHAVFHNASAYTAAVGSLYAAWDVVANMTTDVAAARSVDLVFASDAASAVAAKTGNGTPPASRLFRAGMALLALCLASTAVIAVVMCRCKCRHPSSRVPDAATTTIPGDVTPPLTNNVAPATASSVVVELAAPTDPPVLPAKQHVVF